MTTVHDASIPASQLCCSMIEFVRDTPVELLHAATMFHDIGLVSSHSREDPCFEADLTIAARDFPDSHSLDPSDVGKMRASIASHTTPRIPEVLHPVIALTIASVEVDVLGPTYEQHDDAA